MSPKAAADDAVVPPGGAGSQTESGGVPLSGLTYADDAAPEGVATLTDLWGQLCPNCSVGVLLVTRYDPDALHEQNQGAALDRDSATGGAYEVNCFNCHFHESRILPDAETEEG